MKDTTSIIESCVHYFLDRFSFAFCLFSGWIETVLLNFIVGMQSSLCCAVYQATDNCNPEKSQDQRWFISSPRQRGFAVSCWICLLHKDQMYFFLRLTGITGLIEFLLFYVMILLLPFSNQVRLI